MCVRLSILTKVTRAAHTVLMWNRFCLRIAECHLMYSLESHTEPKSSVRPLSELRVFSELFLSIELGYYSG